MLSRIRPTSRVPDSFYTMSSDDVEIDDAPDVGIAEEGAWVAAWVWVMQEEAGLYEKEATPNLKG